MNGYALSVILCAGGVGSRMGSATPKQFLMLGDKPVARHSFDLFLGLPEVVEIVVVCDPAYRALFHTEIFSGIRFALPGERRQDSVYHGLQALSSECRMVCVHDAARPFITPELVRCVASAAAEYGAAAAGLPMKYTVKEVNRERLVIKTVDRSQLWEIQTPQIMRRELLEKGYEYANARQLTLTDDVSFVEQLGLPVKLVEGSYDNFKLTTPEDLEAAHRMVYGRG